MADTVFSDLDFLLGNLKQLLKIEDPIICDNQSIRAERNQIQWLHDELGLLRTFLFDSEKCLYDHEEGKSLTMKIKDVVSEADDIVDSFVFSAVAPNIKGKLTEQKDRAAAFGFPLNLNDVMTEIWLIKLEVMAMKIDNITVHEKPTGSGPSGSGPSGSGSSMVSTPFVVEEDIIGAFDKDELNIIERLTGNQKQLDIISIVGMAGIGKTTLVRKVYNNPLISHHFSIRAWISVSQVYQKRNLLLGILNSFVSLTVADQIHEMNEQELCDKLFKSLKCYRYLIVMDDIWDARVWNDLKVLFPNVNNGSRVILTSRNKNVVLEALPGSHPYVMGFRTEGESWDLLERKVFGEDRCPPRLSRIGRQIAKKCQGLPLAIVVIAGLLSKRAPTEYDWMKVAESVSPNIVEDPKMLMNTLALSYTHLPYHLKACFLYLGAFPEDYEIPVWKLIWLWVAEGFIKQEGGKSLEDIAEDCLTDLINRNLVIVARRRFNGGIKACCVHDLLRELCSTKAKEDQFLQQVYSSELFFIKERRFFIHSHLFEYISLNSYAPHVRSVEMH